MAFDKEEVKEQLELEQVYELLESLDAEPELFADYIVARTICHGGHSNKLYYWDNTKLFHCFTECNDSFDIFELLMKIKDIDLNDAVYYIVQYFNLQYKLKDGGFEYLDDFKLFKNHQHIGEITPYENKIVNFKDYNQDILKCYPQPRIKSWIEENISKEICDYMNIHYDPLNGGILIPHYNKDGKLIGVRIRTLSQENEQYGKYRPAYLDGELFTHPLGFNLYGLDKAKENIRKGGVAIVFESEKAVLQFLSIYGVEGDFAVAVCGNSLSQYQFNLLLDAGAAEICIGFDKDFEQVGDENYYRVINKLEKLYNKYGSKINISFLFDKDGDKLGYKNSPIDCGQEVFEYLWRHRVFL